MRYYLFCDCETISVVWIRFSICWLTVIISLFKCEMISVFETVLLYLLFNCDFFICCSTVWYYIYCLSVMFYVLFICDSNSLNRVLCLACVLSLFRSLPPFSHALVIIHTYINTCKRYFLTYDSRRSVLYLASLSQCILRQLVLYLRAH